MEWAEPIKRLLGALRKLAARHKPAEAGDNWIAEAILAPSTRPDVAASAVLPNGLRQLERSRAPGRDAPYHGDARTPPLSALEARNIRRVLDQAYSDIGVKERDAPRVLDVVAPFYKQLESVLFYATREKTIPAMHEEIRQVRAAAPKALASWPKGPVHGHVQFFVDLAETIGLSKRRQAWGLHLPLERADMNGIADDMQSLALARIPRERVPAR